MNKTELIIVGGFLGSGKTTSILSIAKHILSLGKKVGIVTNDQGSELVDTNYLKSNGLSVLEVTGGCFCCNFDEFIKKVDELKESEYPDVILAEPVGSCTDLIATIFKPIDKLYLDKFALRPLSVVADPKRIRKFMNGEKTNFHSEVDYIFQKQLEEADIIVINKMDTIEKEELDLMIEYMKNKYNGKTIIPVSAKQGFNIENWLENLYEIEPKEKNVLDIDYDIYAKGEERLGWLNLSCSISSDNDFDINPIIFNILEKTKNYLLKDSLEIAHLKAYGISTEDFAKGSITSIYDDVDLNKKSQKQASRWNLILNARVDCEPDVLKICIEKALKESMAVLGLVMNEYNIQYFKPGKPNPRYRLK